jgi:hypothetical protein
VSKYDSAKAREYVQRPEVREKRAAYYQKPEVRERRNARQRSMDRKPTNYKRRLRKLTSLGLSVQEAETQLAKTVCDCCGESFGGETSHIDHDHKTNVFRGMIHLQCNVAIGMFRDRVGAMVLASRYVDPFNRSPLAVDSGSRFLDQLDEIAAEDAAGLHVAAKSYGPSWKQGGGRNAYAMLKRKWDRMVNRLSRPEIDGDIFKAIATDDRGEGVIDDVRDLRRYLLLVEAEMRARGFRRTHRDNKQ